jgi:endonuclease/exonuclease/phosphatase (EEP) superfamily protein YafD
MIRALTWNAGWASPRLQRGLGVSRLLESSNADVIVLTEASAGLLPDGGYTIDGGTDWGYPVQDPARRKVLLWSRRPWSDIDAVGDERMPRGRWVAGTTETTLGPIRVVGVCVPWANAHVSTGRKDRAVWEDHLTFLDGMSGLLRDSISVPMIVAGDFNQRIPRTTQPVEVAEALASTLDGLAVVTAGEVEGHRLIDHVAVRGLTAAGSPTVVPRADLSDHDGVIVNLILIRPPVCR